jgi:hypothetical protein
MKTFNFILIGLAAFVLSSCEDVIDLNLETGAEKYVVEANLSDSLGTCKVLISKTKSFSAPNDFAGQSGARVTITDNQGNISTLAEISPGIYQAPTLKGVPGLTYNLRVEISGSVFTAVSKMPPLVKLEDVYIKELLIFDGVRKMTHVQFTDPAGKGNYYKFVEYRNGVYNKAISVINDDLIDGNLVNQLLAPREFDDESKLQPGDKVKVDFLTIDEPVYKYWFSVESGAQGEGETSAPINPVTNLNGGALGYFSAHTIQSREITVN